MGKVIGLREADQAFARCIREVEAGEEITITRKGRPVARIVPVRRKRILTSEQEGARAHAEAIMREGWDLGIGRFNRDELYDEILGINGPKRR